MATKRICVLTSGGDAPGMNAAIRAVVRSALDRGWQAVGVLNGYAGLIEGTLRPLNDRDVGGIVQRGGTVLGSSRCPELKTEAGQHAAISSLARAEADALIVIGGNGSQAGAHALCGRGVDVIGVASTIDNDLVGCDVTIGVTTAVDVALEAIDRLKVTASSHHRAFLVEVMGRDCGYLALMAAIAGGAEAVAIPELPASVGALADAVRDAYRRGKAHALIVVAEGCTGGSTQLAADLAAHHTDVGFDVRVPGSATSSGAAPPTRSIGSLPAAPAPRRSRRLRTIARTSWWESLQARFAKLRSPTSSVGSSRSIRRCSSSRACSHGEPNADREWSAWP